MSAASKEAAFRPTAIQLALGPVFVALAVRLWHGGPSSLPSDDFYISLHAARVLGGGGDPSYPEASALTGVTSPLHVLLLRLAMVVVPVAFAGELLAWIGSFLYLYAAARLIVRHLDTTVDRVAALVVACLCGSVPLHLLSGQETPWALAAVLWLVHDLQGRRTSARVSWLAGLLPWLRPDLAFWSAGAFMWRWWQAPERRLRDGLIAIVCATAYVSFWWLATGHLLPDTIAAKREFFAYYALPLSIRLLVAVIVIGQYAAFAGVVLILAPGAVRTLDGRLAFLVAVAFWTVFMLGGAASLNHNYFRYAQPFVVPLVLLGAIGWPRRARRVVLIVAACSVIYLAPQRWDEYRQWQAIATGAQQVMADWLNVHTGAGTSVLVHDAGYLSEKTSAVLTDLVGLKTPSSVAIHARLTGPSAGVHRGDAVHEIGCRAKPEYLAVFNEWDATFSLTYDLMRHGWVLVPVARKEVPGGASLRAFTLYRLVPPAVCIPRSGLTPELATDLARSTIIQIASVVQK